MANSASTTFQVREGAFRSEWGDPTPGVASPADDVMICVRWIGGSVDSARITKHEGNVGEIHATVQLGESTDDTSSNPSSKGIGCARLSRFPTLPPALNVITHGSY